MIDIHNTLAAAASAFIKANSIVHPGDIVTTKWTGWKHARRVRITRVSARLVCRWSEEANDWVVGFSMDYTAQRLRKDGSNAERNPVDGICLNRFETTDGRTWDLGGKWREELGFNHSGLSWPRVKDNYRTKQGGQS